jgi:radical SAM superfamily enzyme YgiQ (UPF0313 family)
MTKILFVDAGNPASKLKERFSPLWPGYLAASIENRFGQNKFEFKILKDPIERELVNFRPDVVAISSVTKNYNHAVEYAYIAKQFSIPVVVGGIHISLMPNSFAKQMDVGCIGEGEETFAEIMEMYIDTGGFAPEYLSKINGVIYWENGKLAKTPNRSPISNIDYIPHPKRSLAGYRNTDTIMTARGCPFRCSFCSVSRYWRKVRFAKAQYVIDEIIELAENGVKIIKIYDDLFTINKERLHGLSEMVSEMGLAKKVKFACWCRSNTLDDEVVYALRKMNVVSVELGLESGCDKTLRYLKGNIGVKDNIRAIQLLKNAGIQTNATFIIGSPQETYDEIMETYDFIKNSRLDTVTVNRLIPFPGTPIWDHALDKGLVSETMDWSRIGDTILSETIGKKEMDMILKKFKRLCLKKRLRALPKSPWLKEAPSIVFKRLLSRIMS